MPKDYKLNFFKNSKIANNLKPIVAERKSCFKAVEEKLEPIDYFTREELRQSKGQHLVCDVEVYPNYFLINFKSIESKKCLSFEMSADQHIEKALLRWVLDNFTIVTFNGIKFDMILIWLMLETEVQCFDLYVACDMIIRGGRAKDVEKQYDFRQQKLNHIDLIEVAPLSASLKIYSGRMHAIKMQDLPIEPGTYLTLSLIHI